MIERSIGYETHTDEECVVVNVDRLFVKLISISECRKVNAPFVLAQAHFPHLNKNNVTETSC